MAKNQVMLTGATTRQYIAAAVLTSGQGVLMSKTLGVAETNANIGDQVAISVLGVYTLPKDPTKATAIGDSLFWDAANNRLTTTASGNTYAGKAWSIQAAADATVDCNLNLGSA